ncbi:hypothetical protein J5N97_014137 [Dioscorea zingiberensis]|uniref:CCHC-type domain-containing protein n=1 Tax=Dioscorea zingiberensis TaxID=325984 RepID=A0A9D5HJH5_9LILI|nr:hypothetical protein J5N97_014137 [Dioscorea zingiberensis]
MIRTPTSMVAVCEQCLKHGHRAMECRRAATCRRCRKVEHKGMNCRSKLKERTGEGQHRPPRPRKPPARTKQPNHGPPSTAARTVGTEPHQHEEIHHWEDDWTQTGNDGLPASGRDAKQTVDESWEWPLKPMHDGGVLIACPSTKIARKLEASSPIDQQGFMMNFTAWSLGLWNPPRAEGEIRWVVVCNFPFSFGAKHKFARGMLKPVGDLVYAGGRGMMFADDIRVMVRIKRPKKLPTFIHCTFGTKIHSFKVELADGEAPLPWAARRSTAQRRPMSGEDERGRAQQHDPRQTAPPPRASRAEKGKALAIDPTPALTNGGGRRPTGIVFREPQVHQSEAVQGFRLRSRRGKSEIGA